MCGRYRLTAKERYIRDHFGLDEDPPWTPRWNVAPTQQIATIRQHRSEPKRIFGLMRWGLIPYWAKGPSIGLKAINAMSETAAEKPAFRDAMRWRRCLIPADGFYEWERFGPKEKQPYNFGMADDSPFAFAGLWDRWRDQDNEAIETCTILTTKPNSLVADVHDRMPVTRTTSSFREHRGKHARDNVTKVGPAPAVRRRQIPYPATQKSSITCAVGRSSWEL